MSLPKREYSKRGDKDDCVGHPLYRTWHSMMRRCYLESAKDYSDYGGRGINVDERWWYFKNFLEDMGEKPSPNHTLDRIDNDKGYSKWNCRWATRSEQCVNRRKFKNNTSGNTGICKHNFGYSARYDYEGTRYNIGRFTNIDEAVSARELFIKMFHTDKERAIKSISVETVWNNSSTKIRGISVHPDGGFMVRVTIDKVRHYVGYYKDLEEAKNARLRFIEERAGNIKA